MSSSKIMSSYSNITPFVNLNLFNRNSMDPFKMDPAAGLETLPNEIIAKIVSDPCLRKRDIVALRSTCKLIYAFGTEVFAKRYFKKLRISISPYSLKLMKDICKHPGLGPWVRKVVLTSVRIDPNRLPTFKNQQFLEDEYRGDRFLSKGPDLVLKACDELQACIARYRYEVDLLKDDKAVKELSSNFQILATYGHPIEIGVSDIEESSIGFKKSYGRSNKDMNNRLFVADHQIALKTLIAGASRSTCKINGVAISNQHYHNPQLYTAPKFSKIDISVLDGHQNQPFWNELKSVRFNFHGGKPDNPCKRKMADIVSWAPNLTNIFYSEDQSTVAFEPVVGSVTSCSLEEIVLSGFTVHEASLIQLLARSHASISRLTFSRGKLISGSWRSVMAWVKDNLPNLKYLCVFMLSHMRGKTLVKPAKFLKGKGRVQAGLRNLLMDDLA